MLEIILFIFACLLAIWAATYILTLANWKIGYQMIVCGIILVYMSYSVFRVVPHIYQIIVAQLFINPIVE